MNERGWHGEGRPWMDHRNYDSRNENQKLEALYGKGVIVVTRQVESSEKFSYCCMVCCVDIRGMRNVEEHCSSQIHTKNKMLWQRNLGYDYESRTFEGRGMIRENQWEGIGRSHEPNQRDSGRIEDHGDHYSLNDPTDTYGVNRRRDSTGGSGINPSAPALPSAQHIIDLARRNVPPPAKEGLFDGQLGTLLKELANCAVKDEVDAVMSTEVVLALLKLLKDYLQNLKGCTSTLQMRLILDETVVKIHKVKSLLDEEGAARQVEPSVPGPNQSFKRSGEDDDYPPNPRKAFKPEDKIRSIDY